MTFLSTFLIKIAFFFSKPTSYNDGLSWYREDAGRKGRYSLYSLNKVETCNSNRLLVNKLTK